MLDTRRNHGVDMSKISTPYGVDMFDISTPLMNFRKDIRTFLRAVKPTFSNSTQKKTIDGGFYYLGFKITFSARELSNHASETMKQPAFFFGQKMAKCLWFH